MSEPARLDRARATRDLERSKVLLAASLRDLQSALGEKLSPRRALEAHLGVFLAGAFAVGVGLAIGRRER